MISNFTHRICFVLLLLTFGNEANTQTTDATYWKSLDSLLLSYSTPADQVWDQLLNKYVVFEKSLRYEDFQRMESKLQQRLKADKSISNEYLLAQLRTFWYCYQGSVGDALVAASNFTRMAENDVSFVLRSHALTGSVYSHFELYEENVKLERKIYQLRIQNGLEVNSIKEMDALGALSWSMFQAGNATNDKQLLDSSAYYRKQVIDFCEAHPQDIALGIETYKTYLMAILTLERPHEVIAISNKMLVFCSAQMHASASYENTFNIDQYTRKALSYKARAFAELGQRDSAFACLEDKRIFVRQKDARGVFYEANNAILDFDE